MTWKIYLASRSPRRAELLRQLGLDCEILPADIDETALAGEPPADYVLRLARGKAAACLQALAPLKPELPILAADTTVCIDGRILGKPEDDADAATMLRSLSGTWHEVHTAVAVASAQGIATALSTTRVEMAELSDGDIAAYVASGEPRDKAGAYGIQGLAGTFVKRIEGSYSGVMGLPIYETSVLLGNAGVRLL